MTLGEKETRGRIEFRSDENPVLDGVVVMGFGPVGRLGGDVKQGTGDEFTSRSAQKHDGVSAREPGWHEGGEGGGVVTCVL